MTGPARITIELEAPTSEGGRWAARTRIAEPEPLEHPALVEQVHVSEAREPVVVPAGYEPPEDCTCLDGYCEADHANE
jgi:hypothetical protein